MLTRWVGWTNLVFELVRVIPELKVEITVRVCWSVDGGSNDNNARPSLTKVEVRIYAKITNKIYKKNNLKGTEGKYNIAKDIHDAHSKQANHILRMS